MDHSQILDAVAQVLVGVQMGFFNIIFSYSFLFYLSEP